MLLVLWLFPKCIHDNVPYHYPKINFTEILLLLCHYGFATQDNGAITIEFQYENYVMIRYT